MFCYLFIRLFATNRLLVYFSFCIFVVVVVILSMYKSQIDKYSFLNLIDLSSRCLQIQLPNLEVCTLSCDTWQLCLMSGVEKLDVYCSISWK